MADLKERPLVCRHSPSYSNSKMPRLQYASDSNEAICCFSVLFFVVLDLDLPSLSSHRSFMSHAIDADEEFDGYQLVDRGDSDTISVVRFGHGVTTYSTNTVARVCSRRGLAVLRSFALL